MTLEKAINTLRNTPVQVIVGNNLDFGLARRLGIEALEAYKLARQDGQLSPDELLPSETKG